MADPHALDRFVAAQAPVLHIVLAELEAGAKRSHWMWFVFPQLAGLGRSETTRFYGLSSLDDTLGNTRYSVFGCCNAASYFCRMSRVGRIGCLGQSTHSS